MDSLFKIYLFMVTFQDKKGKKERPIVTLFYDHQAFSFEVVGIYKSRSKYKNNPYYKKFMYKIKDYKKANLHYPSYVNVARPFNIPFTALIGRQSFGQLSAEDAKGLINFYTKFWNNH